jgi:hypothetical protein
MHIMEREQIYKEFLLESLREETSWKTYTEMK